jgi:two-component system nitrate/nitrite response regulator NarL
MILQRAIYTTERGALDRIKVLIIDDSPAIRESIHSILRSHSDIEVVGTCGSGQEAICDAVRLQPHVILVDAQMPQMDGVETTRQVKEKVPEAKIIFMAVHATHIEEALKAGADGFLMKDAGRQEFLRNIRRMGEHPHSV